MNGRRDNSDERRQVKSDGADTATQGAEPSSQFKRSLVPLDEYATREGLSSDIVEKQGQIGVVQIRKFKGQKFVVDVALSPSDISDEEAEKPKAGAGVAKVEVKRRWSVSAVVAVFLLAAGVCAALWLYVDVRMALENLNRDYMTLQTKYDDVVDATANAETVQSELALARAELARIQSQINTSRAEVERISGSLSDARRDLETVQGELTGIQGQISLSRAEIESVQNGLNSNKTELDTLSQRNIEFAGER